MSERLTIVLEVEQEADGRWSAEIELYPFPGCLAYGDSKEIAIFRSIEIAFFGKCGEHLPWRKLERAIAAGEVPANGWLNPNEGTK